MLYFLNRYNDTVATAFDLVADNELIHVTGNIYTVKNVSYKSVTEIHEQLTLVDYDANRLGTFIVRELVQTTLTEDGPFAKKAILERVL